MAARILSARELGDLKENAEYHIAKEDQAHLETRIKRLQQRLREARVVEVPAGATDEVVFGATVTVIDEESGKEATYTIVGPTEADMPAGKLSAESPVAQALLGQKRGAVAIVATPRGERRLRIDRLG
jgi:transcription elongation factor GreA